MSALAPCQPQQADQAAAEYLLDSRQWYRADIAGTNSQGIVGIGVITETGLATVAEVVCALRVAGVGFRSLFRQIEKPSVCSVSAIMNDVI